MITKKKRGTYKYAKEMQNNRRRRVAKKIDLAKIKEDSQLLNIKKL